MTIPFPMPTFPSPTAAMPPDAIAFNARGNDNQLIAGLNQVQASIAALGHTLTFGTHLQAAGTSYNGSANVTIATDATSANTVSTLVARDGSGNFSAAAVSVTSLTASATVSGADLLISTNAHHLKAIQSTSATVNVLAVPSTNTTRFIAAVDSSGFEWTNQAESTQWAALTQSIFTIWTGGSPSAGGGLRISSGVNTTAAVFNVDPNHHQFGQGSIDMYPVSISGGHGAGATASLSYWSGASLVAAVSVANVNSGTGTLTISPAVKMSHFGAGLAQFDASGNMSSVALSAVTGGISYAQLPTGAGTWNTGSPSNTVTLVGSLSPNAITGAVAVSGQLNFTNATAAFTIQPGGSVLSVVATSQTGVASVTIPNFAGMNDTFAFLTLAQTLSNKTLDASCTIIGPVLTTQGGTGLASYTAGDLLYYAGATAFTKLAIGAANTVLTSTGSAPQWSANLAYAALPTGNGTWDTGVGNTTTFAQNVTVTGTLTATVTGSITGNAATATALQTTRTINGVLFDGTANITVTAAAGTLTGATLNSTVITSSLTTIGTLIAGGVPASLVTAGTFGAGAYTFSSTLTVAGLITANAGVVINSDANNLFNAVTGGAPHIFRTTASGTPVLTFSQSEGSIAIPTASSTGRNLAVLAFQGYNGSGYATGSEIVATTTQAWATGTPNSQGTKLLFLTTPNGSATLTTALTIDQDQSTTFSGLATGAFNGRFGPNFTVGNSGAVILSYAALRIASTVTASSANAYGVINTVLLTAAANSDTLHGIDISPMYSTGALTGVKIVGISIGGISTAGLTSPGDPIGISLNAAITGTGATNAYAIKLGAGPTGATNNYLIHATNFQLTSAGALTTASDVSLTTGITKYQNVATAGFGVSPIYASGRKTAQAAASGTVCTYTPAADGTFTIVANVNVTAVTTASFTVTCTYTDEGGTSRTSIFTFSQISGTLLTTITNVTGTGAYEGVPLTIRAKGANAITIQTASGGTYTSVTYNISAAITQLAA